MVYSVTPVSLSVVCVGGAGGGGGGPCEALLHSNLGMFRLDCAIIIMPPFKPGLILNVIILMLLVLVARMLSLWA